MIIEFRGYCPPTEENTIVWRYMDFTKFVDLLAKKALYFTRSINFEDPFEGLYPMKITEGNKEFHKSASKIREFCFVNCWHISEHESAAMWNLYLSSKEGISIKTTVGNLKKAFNQCQEEILISKVKYWDYENGDSNQLFEETKNEFGVSTVNPVIFKRKSFEHEKELRLIYNTFSFDSIDSPPNDFGKSIICETEQLIQEIYIAPYAPQWFLELVKNVCDKYGLRKVIIKSNLYQKPEIN